MSADVYVYVYIYIGYYFFIAPIRTRTHRYTRRLHNMTTRGFFFGSAIATKNRIVRIQINVYTFMYLVRIQIIIQFTILFFFNSLFF